MHGAALDKTLWQPILFGETIEAAASFAFPHSSTLFYISLTEFVLRNTISRR
jgi:hypothetical protein